MQLNQTANEKVLEKRQNLAPTIKAIVVFVSKGWLRRVHRDSGPLLNEPEVICHECMTPELVETPEVIL